METNARILPKLPDTQNHGDSKAQYLTRPTTHAAITTFSTSPAKIMLQKLWLKYVLLQDEWRRGGERALTTFYIARESHPSRMP